MKQFSFVDTDHPIRYEMLSDWEKEWIDKRIIEIKEKNGRSIPYNECSEILKERWNIDVDRHQLFEIIRTYRKMVEETRISLMTYEEANEKTTDEILKKMVRLIKADAEINYREFAEGTKRDFSVLLTKEEINNIVKEAYEFEKRDKETEEKIIRTVKVELDGKVVDIEYELHNVVFHGNLFPENEHLPKKMKLKLDLNEFVKWNRDARYEPKRFPGVVLKIDPISNAKATVLLFDTGSFVTVGLKSIEKIDDIRKNLVNRVNRTSTVLDLDDIHTKVVNTVITTKVPNEEDKSLDLNALTLMLEYCLYEPEVFPGLIHKPQIEDKDGNNIQIGSFLIFATRKVVCAGIRDIDKIPEVVSNFVKELHLLGDSIFVKKNFDDVPDKDRFLDLTTL